MGLYELVKSSLNDEEKAGDKYQEMIDAAGTDDKLTDEEKALITGMLFKIQADEASHTLLLEIIKAVLEDK